MRSYLDAPEEQPLKLNLALGAVFVCLVLAIGALVVKWAFL